MYVELLKVIYYNSSLTVHSIHKQNKITTRRGVRQEDTILPAYAVYSIQKTDLPLELHQVQQDQAGESENNGLTMNKSKTRLMLEEYSKLDEYRKGTI